MHIDIQEVLLLIEAILGPKGCPWGKAQKPETLCHYVIEESYEVVDAIKEDEKDKIEEELGDLLFATLFTLVAAAKKYQISEDTILEKICQKIKRRHPHVFENPRPITFEELRVQWEEIKAKERKEQDNGSKKDLLDAVAKSMPPVTRAVKLVELGHSNGFHYEADESFQGRFMQLIIDSLNQFKNLDEVMEEGILDYQTKFKAWLEKEKPEMVS